MPDKEEQAGDQPTEELQEQPVDEAVEPAEAEDATEAEAGAAPEGDSAPEAESEADPEPEAEEEPVSDEPVFSWQASEFVHHHKSPVWYVVVILGLFVLLAAAVWLKLWLEIGVFIAMTMAIIVYARKPPRTLLYELSGAGVKIDGKAHTFKEFRSFAVVEDEEWHSIDLEPTKRFSPRLVLLFDSSNFDEIVSHLELHLPREDRDPDVIERITRYVRF